MKKMLIVGLVSGVCCVSAMAQGVVSFANFGEGANGTIAFGSKNVTLGAENLAGTGYSAGLWLSSADPMSDAPLAEVNFGTGFFAGTFSPTSTVTIPGIASAGTANLVVRAWDNSAGDGSWSQSLIRGESVAFDTVLGDAAVVNSYPVLVGMNTFAITAVPEPSVIMLGIAGAGLLWFRRKK